MGLYELEDKLRKRFIGKYCKVIGELNDDYSPVVYKWVSNIVDIYGPPSAWYWQAKLYFTDDTTSHSFTRMKDVKIRKEK